MLDASSPRNWSTEPTLTKSAMESNSRHNIKMSGSANHAWLIPLQQGMQRSASKRGRHNLTMVEQPESPLSEQRLARTSHSRSRLMTEPHENSPARRSKKSLAKPLLHRRATAPSCMSHSPKSPSDIDVPQEISIRLCLSDRDEVDSISDLSLNDDEEVFAWGKSFPVGDTSQFTNSTHIVESSGSSEPQRRGNAPLFVDYHEIWPSDEGSPVKRKQEEERTDEDLPPMMLQLCSLDDERQDFSLMPLDSSDLVFRKVLDDDRHEQSYVL